MHHADGSAARSQAPGSASTFRADFQALQREVQALRGARQRLSQQLTLLWRDNQRLQSESGDLEAQHAVLAQERRILEEQHREKSRQLLEAIRRLQELADTSEDLLQEKTLLRVLLRALEDRTQPPGREEAGGEEAQQSRSHLTS